MIKLTDIHNKIVDKLKEYTAITVISSDLTEPIMRPSIKVTLVANKSGKENSSLVGTELICRIYFFPTLGKKSKLEIMHMQGKIFEALQDPLMITESYCIYIDEVDAEMSDGVLICSFNSNTIRELDLEQGQESMEELEVKIDTGNYTMGDLE